MIPLIYFLTAWFIFLGVFSLIALLSVFQMLRFGVAAAGTYISTSLFLIVSMITILGCGTYFVSTDWQSSVNLFGDLASSPYFNP